MKKLIIIIALSAALLCLCVSMVGIFWFSIRQIDSFGAAFSPVSVGAEASEEKILEVSGPATLEVRISNGDITINAAEVDAVTIRMHKTAYAESQAKAEEELRNMQVNITQNGSNIQVVFEPPAIPMNLDVYQSDRVDLTIQVPTETEVTAYSGSGDVSISGTRARASIASDYGDLYASEITGSLSADTGSGAVNASDIQAGQADIDLKSGYGDITLETAHADAIQATSGSGSLKLSFVDANSQVTLQSDYGGIGFTGGSAQLLTINTSSGRIDLANLEISADLKAKSDYGDLDLKQVAAGAYDLETSSGSVTVEDARGAIKAHSGYGNIEVAGEDATLSLSTSSGSVEYSGTLGEGPHTLQSDYGSITITIPADTALDIDLKTDYGKIKSAIPVTLSGDLEEEHWVGSLNGGGESLTASTSSGDIQIEVIIP
jgi:DUF4097 and DUF4098 domain-containing protein YvlB